MLDRAATTTTKSLPPTTTGTRAEQSAPDRKQREGVRALLTTLSSAILKIDGSLLGNERVGTRSSTRSVLEVLRRGGLVGRVEKGKKMQRRGQWRGKMVDIIFFLNLLLGLPPAGETVWGHLPRPPPLFLPLEREGGRPPEEARRVPTQRQNTARELSVQAFH